MPPRILGDIAGYSGTVRRNDTIFPPCFDFETSAKTAPFQRETTLSNGDRTEGGHPADVNAQYVHRRALMINQLTRCRTKSMRAKSRKSIEEN